MHFDPSRMQFARTRPASLFKSGLNSAPLQVVSVREEHLLPVGWLDRQDTGSVHEVRIRHDFLRHHGPFVQPDQPRDVVGRQLGILGPDPQRGRRGRVSGNLLHHVVKRGNERFEHLAMFVGELRGGPDDGEGMGPADHVVAAEDLFHPLVLELLVHEGCRGEVRGDVRAPAQHRGHAIGMAERHGQVIELAMLTWPDCFFRRHLKRDRLDRDFHRRQRDPVLVGKIAN